MYAVMNNLTSCVIKSRHIQPNYSLIRLADIILGAPDMQDFIDIASEMPTSSTAGVQDANTKGAFECNGCVTYVPTIQDLDGIVSQLMSFLSKTVCVYEIH